MAVTYGFYNSLNKDRMYNAEQMSSIFNGIITDGVFASIGGSLMPIAGTGMQVVVKTGKCWFNSTWTQNDALLPLDIPAADVSLTRIDAVVVEINSAISTRANTIKVIKGIPSANLTKPALANTETLHQYALGYITVGAGVTNITADKIEVNVGKTTCPFITSVLQQTDITALFNQWDAEFSAWFANIQSQLSGDIAANLQRQIDECKPGITAKGTIIGATTAQVLQIAEGSNVDDALLKLAMPEGKYALQITLLTPGNRPIPNVVITGITTISGGTVTTDANGKAFGFTTANPVTVTPDLSKLLDLSDNVSQSFSLTSGIVNQGVMTATHLSETQTLVTSSGSFYFSPDVAEYDWSAIGGGYNGGAFSTERINADDGVNYYFKYTTGFGGAAGGVVNRSGISYNNEAIAVVVGAVNGGKSSVNGIETGVGASGGTSGITANDIYMQPRINPGVGQATIDSFLYPPTSVGGSGGGGGCAFGTSSDYAATNIQGANGGSPGGGNGCKLTTTRSEADEWSNEGAVGIIYARAGTYYGSGGGGAGAYLLTRTSVISSSPGSGKQGVVGFMWRYKS